MEDAGPLIALAGFVGLTLFLADFITRVVL